MAMVHAINNEAIVKKIMKGFATTAAQFSPEGYLGYNASLKPRFDLKLAKQLMKDGWDVRNLKGSVLLWTYTGKPLEHDGAPTQKVHTYARKWDFPEPKKPDTQIPTLPVTSVFPRSSSASQ